MGTKQWFEFYRIYEPYVFSSFFVVIEPTSVSAGAEPTFSTSGFRGPAEGATDNQISHLYIPKQYGFSSGFKG